MKFATVSKSVILGLALLLASSAFAETKGIEINNTVTVNGTKLKPGDYKLEWNGSGPSVELSIMRGSKVVAKVPVRVVDLQSPAANTATEVKTDGNGTASVTGFRFQGKKYGLELADAGGNMAGGSQ
ncbi:MAG: hypothetical protein ACLQLC_02640 [Candidatus Sulfotelmatobacter sp.]